MLEFPFHKRVQINDTELTYKKPQSNLQSWACMFTFSCYPWVCEEFPIRSPVIIRKNHQIYLRIEIKQAAIRDETSTRARNPPVCLCVERSGGERRWQQREMLAHRRCWMDWLTHGLTPDGWMEVYVCATLRASLLRQSVTTREEKSSAVAVASTPQTRRMLRRARFAFLLYEKCSDESIGFTHSASQARRYREP